MFNRKTYMRNYMRMYKASLREDPMAYGLFLIKKREQNKRYREKKRNSEMSLN